VVWFTGGIDKSMALPILLAHAITVFAVYQVYATVHHPDYVFGPTCSTTLAECFVYETSCTAMLTFLCTVPSLFAVNTRLKSVLASCWIAASVRMMMELTLDKTGASMNGMIALAYFFYKKQMFSEEAVMYYVSSFAGAVIGVYGFSFFGRIIKKDDEDDEKKKKKKKENTTTKTKVKSD
jgi:hypothetical protein